MAAAAAEGALSARFLRPPPAAGRALRLTGNQFGAPFEVRPLHFHSPLLLPWRYDGVGARGGINGGGGGVRK